MNNPYTVKLAYNSIRAKTRFDKSLKPQSTLGAFSDMIGDDLSYSWNRLFNPETVETSGNTLGDIIRQQQHGTPNYTDARHIVETKLRNDPWAAGNVFKAMADRKGENDWAGFNTINPIAASAKLWDSVADANSVGNYQDNLHSIGSDAIGALWQNSLAGFGGFLTRGALANAGRYILPKAVNKGITNTTQRLLPKAIKPTIESNPWVKSLIPKFNNPAARFTVSPAVVTGTTTAEFLGKNYFDRNKVLEPFRAAELAAIPSDIRHQYFNPDGTFMRSKRLKDSISGGDVPKMNMPQPIQDTILRRATDLENLANLESDIVTNENFLRDKVTPDGSYFKMFNDAMDTLNTRYPVYNSDRTVSGIGLDRANKVDDMILNPHGAIFPVLNDILSNPKTPFSSQQSSRLSRIHQNAVSGIQPSQEDLDFLKMFVEHEDLTKGLVEAKDQISKNDYSPQFKRYMSGESPTISEEVAVDDSNKFNFDNKYLMYLLLALAAAGGYAIA